MREQVRMQKAEQLILLATYGHIQAVKMLVADIRRADPSAHNRVHVVYKTIIL